MFFYINFGYCAIDRNTLHLPNTKTSITSIILENIKGESQNFCHCVHATNYKFVFINSLSAKPLSEKFIFRLFKS